MLDFSKNKLDDTEVKILMETCGKCEDIQVIKLVFSYGCMGIQGLQELMRFFKAKRGKLSKITLDLQEIYLKEYNFLQRILSKTIAKYHPKLYEFSLNLYCIIYNRNGVITDSE